MPAGAASTPDAAAPVFVMADQSEQSRQLAASPGKHHGLKAASTAAQDGPASPAASAIETGSAALRK
jgi:hypothetical protein